MGVGAWSTLSPGIELRGGSVDIASGRLMFRMPMMHWGREPPEGVYRGGEMLPTVTLGD